MAWSCSSMAFQLHPHCRASLFTFNFPANPGAQHAALLPPVKNGLHFRCKRVQSLSLRASAPYKSAFTPSTLLRPRSPFGIRRMITTDKWNVAVVRSGQSVDEGKGAGVAGNDDIVFSATDAEIEGEQVTDNSGGMEGPAYLTVEEIEVDGSESGPPELLLNEIVEADMDVEGSGRPHQLFSCVIRILSGVPKEEESSFQNSTSRKNTKLWRNPLRILDGSTPLATDSFRRKIADGFRRAQDDLFAFSSQLSKYIFIMTATGAILATGFQLSGGESHQEGVLWFSWLAGVIIGSMIGAGQVLESHAKRGRRNVVITGSTRGLGKALAREFLRAGDNVVIASRSPESVRGTVAELQKEVQEKYRASLLGGDSHVETLEGKADKIGSKVVGMACDVSSSEDVQALAEMALAELGSIDIWINNAGMNKGFRPLVEFSDEEISEIVSTNLTGSLICTREAIRVMKKQSKGGHIFNMDGAGSGGASTPLTAVYGATKCGLRQLSASLLQECKGSRVGIHTASPGMVLTDLLLSGASLQNKKMFNIICEQPETVAQALVPNLRTVKGTGKAVEYLTPPRIVLAILNAWFRRGRWFDEEGRAVYAAEAERLRLWAEGREKSPVTAAMEMVPSGAWVSLFSSSVLCAYVILSNISGGGSPGT